MPADGQTPAALCAGFCADQIRAAVRPIGISAPGQVPPLALFNEILVDLVISFIGIGQGGHCGNPNQVFGHLDRVLLMCIEPFQQCLCYISHLIPSLLSIFIFAVN
ncbi:hypothetical protein SDC9_129347 [bioreactor metagenome]|uniref:Uncharacterized protein n=1 Tax=bioreactor metagenome TaxID=1076179 RepID=A0A645CYQ4_9ZZZZ